jgi:hypothetical protein
MFFPLLPSYPMDIKYLSDPKGTITGVFIPIEDWEQLKKQYNISENVAPDSGTKLQKGLADALKKAKIEPDESEA